MRGLIVTAVSAAFLLTACGQSEEAASTEAPAPAATETAAAEPAVLSNGMTAAATIEIRQTKLKELGKSFKTISDQLKGGQDLEAITAAAAVVSAQAVDIGDWFPAGSGPESGVETEALAKIWEDADGFAAVVTQFQEAATGLDAAVATGDMAAITAAFQMTGGKGCKACHDSYRLDD